MYIMICFMSTVKRNIVRDKTVAKEWDHILLTANLVADKKNATGIFGLSCHPI